MAYSGFLVKIGDFKIPLNMIKAKSYKDILNTQDLDSYRDSNGILHREVLDHVAPKLEFVIPAGKTEKEINQFFAKIRENYIEKKEKNSIVTSYVSEWGEYVSMEMYLTTSIEFPMMQATEEEIIYDEIRLAWIAY